mgnify:CR=1 FL=1
MFQTTKQTNTGQPTGNHWLVETSPPSQAAVHGEEGAGRVPQEEQGALRCRNQPPTQPADSTHPDSHPDSHSDGQPDGQADSQPGQGQGQGSRACAQGEVAGAGQWASTCHPLFLPAPPAPLPRRTPGHPIVSPAQPRAPSSAAKHACALPHPPPTTHHPIPTSQVYDVCGDDYRLYASPLIKFVKACRQGTQSNLWFLSGEQRRGCAACRARPRWRAGRPPSTPPAARPPPTRAAPVPRRCCAHPPFPPTRRLQCASATPASASPARSTARLWATSAGAAGACTGARRAVQPKRGGTPGSPLSITLPPSRPAQCLCWCSQPPSPFSPPPVQPLRFRGPAGAPERRGAALRDFGGLPLLRLVALSRCVTPSRHGSAPSHPTDPPPSDHMRRQPCLLLSAPASSSRASKPAAVACSRLCWTVRLRLSPVL